MKGIVLAGGTASRLRPLTKAISKHLLPIYDKPMIFYPISTLLLAGVTEITIVVSMDHEEAYKAVLRDGSQWGVSIDFQIQSKPGGLPQAIALVTEQDKTSSHLVILGDNIFHGVGLGQSLNHVSGLAGAVAFAQEVQNPKEYGVIELDQNSEILSMEEKPRNPKSNFVVPGLYYFDSRATDYVSGLRPSNRGELEIVDLLTSYWRDGSLKVEKLQRGTAWFDAGSPESLFTASQYVKVLQERQGALLGSPDEVAWRLGLINDAELETTVGENLSSSYGRSLSRLLL
jgi:glucose-1-phosphate thymidylyltransferase